MLLDATGQALAAFGEGVVGATVQRVTIATDDNAVTDLATLAGAVSGTEMQVDIVSGTVTANLSATDNAVLDTIDAVLDTINAKLVTGTVIGDVNLGATDNAVLDAIAASTAATEAAVEGTLTVGSHAVTNAGTFATQVDGDALTALQLIDDAVYADDADWTDTTSKHMLVGGLFQSTEQTITDGDVGPLSVDTNGRLKVSIEVDNVGIGGGIQHDEDVAHQSGDTGTMALAVRNDTLESLAGTDGDYTPLQVDADGALYVNVAAGSASGTEFDEDTQHTTGDAGVQLLAVRRDADTSLVGTDNDYAPLQVNAAGALKVEIFDGGDSHTIDGTVTAELSATDNAVLDTIETNTDFGAVVGGGTEATALRVTIANNSTGVISVDDNGGALTVDGTVTANLSATDNAVLDTIDAVLDTINAKLVTGTVIGDVNLGATDNAVLDAIAADGDAVQALLTTIDADTSTLAGAVSGTEMQVDVVAALPTGSNAIGKLAANSGVDIGDVDVLSIIPGVGATNLGKAIDSAAGATDTGVVMLGMRDDTLSSLTPIEGDYVQLRVNSEGALHVTGAGGGTQHVVDDALGSTPTGTLAIAIRDDSLSTLTPVEGDAVGLRTDATGALWVTPTAGDAEVVDDAAFSPGSTSVVMVGFEFDDTTPDSVDEGDGGAARMSANRNIYTQLRDAAGNERGANVDASNRLTVVADLGPTDNAVLDSIQTAVELIDNTIIAHDASAASASVNMIGLEARSTAITAVGSADAVRATATLTGKQVTVPYAIPALSWSYASPAAVTDTSDDAARAAQGAGVRNYVTGVQVFNGHDTVGTEVVIKSATTVLWRGWAEQTGGGCSARFDPPLMGGENEAINVANITTGSSTYFNLQGFTAVSNG
jgi:hypothetical protein